MKPEQRKIRAEKEGKQAKVDGKKITDNPYLTMGQKGRIYAGFFDKGFNKSRFEYIDIVGDGCEGWINLFFDGQIIVTIKWPELAKKIKSEIPEMELKINER